LSNDVLDNVSGSFKREIQDSNNNSPSAQAQPVIQSTTTRAGGPSSDRTLVLNADVIAEILAATRAMPSWKACVMEGTSWTGTAEENIQKYVSSLGVQDHS
jgi:hypothetical protein